MIQAPASNARGYKELAHDGRTSDYSGAITYVHGMKCLGALAPITWLAPLAAWRQLPVRSFRTLMADLGTLAKNRVRIGGESTPIHQTKRTGQFIGTGGR